MTCLTGKDQEECLMKKLRIFSMVVFVIAAASFGYFKYEQINSKDNQAPVITMDTDSIRGVLPGRRWRTSERN